MHKHASAITRILPAVQNNAGIERALLGGTASRINETSALFLRESGLSVWHSALIAK
jgi:hypothetical protein